MRQMRSAELVQESADLFCAAVFDDELSEAQAARFMRIARELARRDYRFRAHGRKCTCAECFQMFEVWQMSQRRADPRPADFPVSEEGWDGATHVDWRG